MKLIIDGTTYEGVQTESAQILHLMELKVQSRGLVPPDGIGLKLMNSVFTDPEGMSQDDNILAMAAMIFLSRRAAGDNITFTDAMAVSLDDVEVIEDQPEAEEALDEGAGPTPAADPEAALGGGVEAKSSTP